MGKKMKFKFGDKVTDIVFGFGTGVVTKVDTVDRTYFVSLENEIDAQWYDERELKSGWK